MSRNIVAVGYLLAGLAVQPASACDGAGAQRAAVGPALAQAIEQLRAEQRVQVQQAARIGLAQLRSETETALAQGAATPAHAAVQAAP